MKTKMSLLRIAALTAAGLGLAIVAAWAGWSWGLADAAPLATIGASSPASLVPVSAAEAPQAVAPEQAGAEMCGGCRHRHRHHEGDHNCPNCPDHAKRHQHRHGSGHCTSCPYHDTTTDAAKAAPTAGDR